ncbi:MAG: 50S ribosomal protein L30 [Candidatus Schekmanbacteria bacterium]|nr:50S ribosomal protein L30 [Candidatus Schekmanbacteria bacterium]
MANLKIKLKKSISGATERQRQTVYNLGLRKLNQTVVKPDNPCVKGMVTRVVHLLEVEEVA